MDDTTVKKGEYIYNVYLEHLKQYNIPGKGNLADCLEDFIKFTTEKSWHDGFRIGYQRGMDHVIEECRRQLEI